MAAVCVALSWKEAPSHLAVVNLISKLELPKQV